MTLPIFKPSTIDWVALDGGTEEAAWIADRNRKVASMSGFCDLILETFAALKARGLLFHATAETLKEVPFAAWWYISLSGFAQKTLSNIRHRPKSFGLSVQPMAIAEKLSDPDKRAKFLARIQAQPTGTDAQDVERMVEWLNAELGEIFPIASRGPERALAHVSMILGGRVIGQGQNTGGNEAVLLVKQQIVFALDDEFLVETQSPCHASWDEFKLSELERAARIRIGRALVIEFLGGGNNPDIAVCSAAGGPMLVVGEIKGRKDLSNVWESWMPQVVSHLETWHQEYPQAHRIFIGTLINDQMINGQSARGTPRKGLKTLHADGSLSTAFNIAKIVEGDSAAIAHFGEFLDYLRQLVRTLRPEGSHEGAGVDIAPEVAYL